MFHRHACSEPDTRNGAQRKHGRDHAAQEHAGHHVRHVMLVVGHARRPDGPSHTELAQPHCYVRSQMSAYLLQSHPHCGICMHLQLMALANVTCGA